MTDIRPPALRAGFIAGDLPLIGDEHEVWIEERQLLDVARLREEMGNAFVEKYMSKLALYVRVFTIFE